MGRGRWAPRGLEPVCPPRGRACERVGCPALAVGQSRLGVVVAASEGCGRSTWGNSSSAGLSSQAQSNGPRTCPSGAQSLPGHAIAAGPRMGTRAPMPWNYRRPLLAPALPRADVHDVSDRPPAGGAAARGACSAWLPADDRPDRRLPLAPAAVAAVGRPDCGLAGRAPAEPPHDPVHVSGAGRPRSGA